MEIHVDKEFVSRGLEYPVVLHIHREKWGDMERLVKPPPKGLGVSAAPGRGGCIECVGMALPPGSVGDLGNDGHDAIGFIEAVVEGDGVEDKSEVPQVCEHPDGARRTEPKLLLYTGSNAFVKPLAVPREVVLTPEAGRAQPRRTPQTRQGEHRVQFRQIEVGHKERERERMRGRPAPVTNTAHVHSALQGQRRTPRRSQTRSALTTPSS